jgi:hypothetical protein
VAALDGEFRESLEEFDGELLREQEILERKREETASMSGASGSSGGAGGAGGFESGGGMSGESSESAASGAEGAEAGGAMESGGAGTSKPASAGGSDSAGEAGSDRVPADVGDGSDDDIVARQLREAAMKEEDPELREKLWDEYRAYKAGSKG